MRSAECYRTDHETCETPARCDCPCHARARRLIRGLDAKAGAGPRLFRALRGRTVYWPGCGCAFDPDDRELILRVWPCEPGCSVAEDVADVAREIWPDIEIQEAA